MRCYIEERTVELANYIIENKCTVRDTAKKFGISKSTVHTEGVILKNFSWKCRKSQKNSAFHRIKKSQNINYNLI